MRVIGTWSRRELLFVERERNEEATWATKNKTERHGTTEDDTETPAIRRTRTESWRLDRGTCYLLLCILDKTPERHAEGTVVLFDLEGGRAEHDGGEMTLNQSQT